MNFLSLSHLEIDISSVQLCMYIFKVLRRIFVACYVKLGRSLTLKGFERHLKIKKFPKIPHETCNVGREIPV